MRFSLLFSTLLLLFSTQFVPLSAHLTATDSAKHKLRVGVAGNEPFVFAEDESGIAIDIWEEIAKERSWLYNYTPYESVDDAMLALNSGELDLVVGPISITAERLLTSKFSQPFYNSSISILSRKDDQSLWDKIQPFFSLELLYAVGVLVLVLGIVGTLLWLAERKESPEQFPDSISGGVGTGMWLAIVTMTTTGYGDKAPVTVAGRIITSVWMIVSIVSATSLVAGIASILSLSYLGTSTISTIEQLSGKNAATLAGSTAEHYLEEFDVKVQIEPSIEEAVDALESKKVDAVVFDRPQLLYFMKEHETKDLAISKAEYYRQGYGFAFPDSSELDYHVNRTLLELAEHQEIAKIVYTYIKRDE